jgi:predicted secreted protein
MALANRPVQTVILQNYTLDIKLLPENTRAVTTTTLTCTAGALEGATSISVTATTGVTYTIAAGTSLSFVAPTNPSIRQQVLVLANATLAGTTAVSLTIAPLLDPIAANSTSRLVQDMFPLLGITSFGMQPSPTVVDTTHSQSGSGTSSAIVRSKREISIEGIEYVGDIALEHFVKRTFFDPVFMNRELYAIATYPNGSRFEGPSKVTALNLTGTPMEVMKYTCTLEFQDEVLWTPGYYAAGGSSSGFPAYNL